VLAGIFRHQPAPAAIADLMNQLAARTAPPRGRFGETSYEIIEGHSETRRATAGGENLVRRCVDEISQPSCHR